MVIPRKQPEPQQFHLPCASRFFHKARATFSQNCFEPGRSTAFRFNNGASPECEGLPVDVFLVGPVETVPWNLHQLPAGSTAGNVPDSSFELGKLRCLHLSACTLHQLLWKSGTERCGLPEATENESQVQVGQRGRVATKVAPRGFIWTDLLSSTTPGTRTEKVGPDESSRRDFRRDAPSL